MCGKIVDAILKGAAIEKSFDNLTIVMIGFKNLLNYFSKIENETNSKNIKILEEEG